MPCNTMFLAVNSPFFAGSFYLSLVWRCVSGHFILSTLLSYLNCVANGDRCN